MPPPACILLYGLDPLLIEVRSLILERAGFEVHTATELSQVEEIVAKQPVALLILCHTLSAKDGDQARSAAIRKRKAMKHLVLTEDTEIFNPGGLEEFLAAYQAHMELAETANRIVSTYGNYRFS